MHNAYTFWIPAFAGMTNAEATSTKEPTWFSGSPPPRMTGRSWTAAPCCAGLAMTVGGGEFIWLLTRGKWLFPNRHCEIGVSAKRHEGRSNQEKHCVVGAQTRKRLQGGQVSHSGKTLSPRRRGSRTCKHCTCKTKSQIMPARSIAPAINDGPAPPPPHAPIRILVRPKPHEDKQAPVLPNRLLSKLYSRGQLQRRAGARMFMYNLSKMKKKFLHPGVCLTRNEKAFTASKIFLCFMP